MSVIAQRIVDEITNVEFCPKEGHKEAKDKIRAEFYFKVDRKTLDLFFNSSEGYRAQYYIDPQWGTKCNRFMIDAVKEKLIDVARQSSQSMMTFEQVKKSLESDSAKIWIHENDSTLSQTDKDPTEIVALEISRWVQAMSQVLVAWAKHQQVIPTIQSRALLGVQAPEGSRMKILGAWLDNNNQEFVVPSKVHRSLHIHQYGFS